MSVPRIVVVEDNPAEVALLRHALDHLHEEYIFEVLSDGEAALQFVQEHRAGSREPEPCVILLDLYLPKHDGLAVLAAIRRQPDLAHIHVMVLTGSVNPADRQKIYSLGALYREKPASVAHYIELAAEILELCKNGAPVAAGA